MRVVYYLRHEASVASTDQRDTGFRRISACMPRYAGDNSHECRRGRLPGQRETSSEPVDLAEYQVLTAEVASAIAELRPTLGALGDVLDS